MYTYDWSIFGYYGGKMHTVNYESYYTWYQVDDFGNLFEMSFPDKYDFYNTYCEIT